MNFLMFLEEKIFFLLFQFVFLLFVSFFLLCLNANFLLIFFLLLFYIGIVLCYLLLEYCKIVRKEKEIKQIINDLEEKYYIASVLPKPKERGNQGYYYALQKACKAMNDKISELEKEKVEYQEYVESFAHEIKTPISALSLVFDNKKDDELKEEVGKIDNLVEQILYYARSDNTEKDYFVKEVKLEDAVHEVLLSYRNYILKQKITMAVKLQQQVVYTDEKWLHFILSQIIQNSIKYLDKKEKVIEIKTIEHENNLALSIIDNGCGIKKSDLPRIFEKGFTGTNRKKEHSTGIGLYLVHKLVTRLGMKIEIESEEKKYTKVTILFPKTDMYHMK